MIDNPENFEVLTSDSEKVNRFALCNSCEKITTMDSISTCDACACPIDYVITYKFKICPLNKWGI